MCTVMQSGLLWFDDDKARTTSDKISRGAQRYEQKYGHRPDVCYVHPMYLKDGDVQPPDGIRALPAKTVLPYHFWLGIEPAKAKR